MAIIKLDMCSYEVERIDEFESGCGGEFMENGWSPELQLQQVSLNEQRSALPEAVAGMDIKHLLQRMYSFQS